MPSESSDLETSFDSDDTEMNFIDGYELEDEGQSSRVSPRSPETSSDSSDDDVAYIMSDTCRVICKIFVM